MDSMAIPASLKSAIREYALCADPTALIHITKQLYNDGQTNGNIPLLLSKLLDTTDADCLAILAQHYRQGIGVVQNVHKAEQFLKNAAKQGSTQAQKELGHIHFDQGKYLHAIEYFSLCSVNTDYFSSEELGEIFRYLGSSHHKLADPDYQKATRYYTEAAEKYGDTESYRHLATVCIEDEKNRDVPKALRYFEIAAKQGDLYSIQQLGWVFINGIPDIVKQDLEKAEAYLMPYSSCDEHDIIALIGDLYIRKKDWKRSAQFLQRAWNMQETVACASSLGFAYYNLNDRNAAKKYLKYADDHKDYFFSDCLATIYKREGNSREAIRYYQHAHSCTPLPSSLLSSYIDLLIEDGQYTKAYQLADQGEAQHNDIEFVFQKANLTLTGKVCVISKDEAAEMMEEVLLYDSYKDQAHYALGRYYSESLQHYQAIKHLSESFLCGDSDAAVLIGKIYESGKGSVCIDAEKAFHWYTQAANAGNLTAQKELACFRRGLFGKHKRFKTL